MVIKITKGIGSAVIIVSALAAWLIVTWSIAAPADRATLAPVDPVHTVKQSIIGCDIILDTIIVDYEEYFLALCKKPKRIESDIEPWTNSDTQQQQ